MTPFKGLTPFLGTHDLLETIAFYRDVLGFSVETLHPSANPSFCILKNGASTLIFDANLWTDTPTLTGQLLIDVDDVDAVLREVRGNAPVLWGPEVYSYGRREFSCSDPNGYALVFSEATDDPPTCSE